MGILYVSIVMLALISVKYKKEGYWYDYIDKEQCNVIKGIFILVVFVKHVVPYITKAGYEFSSYGDLVYKAFHIFIGQLLVAMFFFYSGYGVSESVRLKGNDYVGTIPKKRVFNTLLNFDIAVCVFGLLSLLLGQDISIYHFALSLLGWESLGNSSWYIFVILVCYILSYLYFTCRTDTIRVGSGILILLFLIAMFTIGYLKEQQFWYSTMMCFPAGIIFSKYKCRIENFVFDKYWEILITSVTCFLLLNSFVVYTGFRGFFFNLNAVSFAFMIVIITMKLKFKNQFLYWLGVHLFPFYVYQRIPMIALSNIGETKWIVLYPYIFIGLSFIITVIISYYFKYWQVRL